jgi:hypothetical protein
MRIPALGAVVRAFVVASCTCASPALAGDASIRADFRSPDYLKRRIFFFAGLDVARDSAFGWAGVTAAPVGLLSEDGLRLRIMGGAGRYRYRTSVAPGGINEGNVGTGEIMLGFRGSLAEASVTVYLGAHVEDQRLAAPDPGNAAAGTAAGVKAAIETHLRIDATWTLTASAAASTVHRSYHARAAVAREIALGVATGFEAAVLGDARYVEPRAGLFVSTTYGQLVFTLAGGMLSNSDKGGGAYATLSLYAPY